MSRSTLMLITGKVNWERQPDIATGHFPRKDYFELARVLDADIIDHSDLPTGWVANQVRRWLGTDVVMAWEGFRRRHQYRLVYSDSEGIGIPLAFLFKLARERRPHLMIAHYLTPMKKQFFFRFLKIHSHIDKIICHSSRQQRRAIEKLGVPEEKIALLPYQVDQHWWSMEALAANEAVKTDLNGKHEPGRAGADTPVPTICSAGLERRDYATLIEAVDGLPVKLVIAAASYWSKQQNDVQEKPLPPNVEIIALDYQGLRKLYAQSAFVVMPLQDVDFQAGVTTILEAMSMSKAIVVTHSLGQEDVVIDRRAATRGLQLRVLPNGFARREDDPQPGFGPNGLYVPPGDVAALRRAIRFLLDNPEMAVTLGKNGEQLVNEMMNLDAFVERIAALGYTDQPKGQTTKAPHLAPTR